MDRPHFSIPEAFAIKYNSIDEEHARLVEIVNRWMDYATRGTFTEFDREFEHFVDAMRSHFEHEERHMRELGYGGLKWHQDHHAECIDEILEIREHCRREGRVDRGAVDACFDKVIMDIARADLKFAEFLDGLGAR